MIAAVADPECARVGDVSHILAEKGLLARTLFQKMHENAKFAPIRRGGGGVRRVRPMLDPPLCRTGIESCQHVELEDDGRPLHNDTFKW